MDGPRDYQIKWSNQKEKRQIPYDIAYIWNLKYDTNELFYETETDSDIENRLAVVKEEGKGGGMDWEFGTSSCKLLYVCITEPLCSTPETNTTL